MRFVEHQVQLQKNEIQEKDVILVKLLSKPLHMELVQCISEPFLTHHPFFMRYAEFDTEAMKRICFFAISSVCFSKRDMVFAEASRDDRMIVVKRGELRYTNRCKYSPLCIVWTPLRQP